MDQFITQLYNDAIGTTKESQIRFLESEIREMHQFIDLYKEELIKSSSQIDELNSNIADCYKEIDRLNDMIIDVWDGKNILRISCEDYETNIDSLF